MSVNKYLGPAGLNELVTLIKNDLAGKQALLQFYEMPDVKKYIGKVLQYVGNTNEAYSKGCFYYSNGIEWLTLSGASFEEVPGLPDWDKADKNTLYFVELADGKTLKPFVKGEHKDEFYVLGGFNFNTLENVPTINGISLVSSDPDKPNDIELKAKVQQYPDTESYDRNAAYPLNPDEVLVDKLYMKAMTDSEIKKTYEEA